MSILIKGMEMPTSCRACQLKMNCDDCEGWECVCVPLRKQIGYLDDLLADKRRDDCPLVPVPPHGRLIDADALAEHKFVCIPHVSIDGKDAGTAYRLGWNTAIEAVMENAETIIGGE